MVKKVKKKEGYEKIEAEINKDFSVESPEENLECKDLRYIG
jgi:hypothetical protein